MSTITIEPGCDSVFLPFQGLPQQNNIDGGRRVHGASGTSAVPGLLRHAGTNYVQCVHNLDSPCLAILCCEIPFNISSGRTCTLHKCITPLASDAFESVLFRICQNNPRINVSSSQKDENHAASTNLPGVCSCISYHKKTELRSVQTMNAGHMDRSPCHRMCAARNKYHLNDLGSITSGSGSGIRAQ